MDGGQIVVGGRGGGVGDGNRKVGMMYCTGKCDGETRIEVDDCGRMGEHTGKRKA